jgi:hypothetical protein
MNIVLANSVTVNGGAVEGRIRDPGKHVGRKDATVRFQERNEFGSRRTSNAAEYYLCHLRHREKSAV